MKISYNHLEVNGLRPEGFQQEIRRPDVQVPNIHSHQELASLPVGLGFTVQPNDDGGRILYSRLRAKGVLKNVTIHGESLDRVIFMQQFVAGLNANDASARRIAEFILEEYPNIRWMRYGEIIEDAGVAVLDGGFGGSDGLLGEVVTMHHIAQTSVGSTKRRRPGIMIVSFQAILDAIRQEIIRVSSHSGYDMTLSPSHTAAPEDYAFWCRNNLQVYSLPDDAAELEGVKQILLEKQI